MSNTRRSIVTGGIALMGLSALKCTKATRTKMKEGTSEDTGKEEKDINSMPSTNLQKILKIAKPREKHWVGDGFNVSTIFSPHLIDPMLLSPFILMDYAEPKQFGPSTKPRGVGEHPHRGFETVTFACQGEVQHRDSHGGGGTIFAGDVQWMSAASGVVHEEFHSHAFSKTGGTFEMVQLWVNLPASKKMNEPGYQLLKGKDFPVVEIGAAKARLIAGQFQDQKGTAQTHSPITMFDMTFEKDGEASFDFESGSTTLLFMMGGDADVQDGQAIDSGGLVVFDRSSVGSILLKASKGARALVLNGTPLNEPVVAHGPFVMNTKEEIIAAIDDYNAGKMGQLPIKER